VLLLAWLLSGKVLELSKGGLLLTGWEVVEESALALVKCRQLGLSLSGLEACKEPVEAGRNEDHCAQYWDISVASC
jgi:hypothetical protein